jgi:hypothetical protein
LFYEDFFLPLESSSIPLNFFPSEKTFVLLLCKITKIFNSHWNFFLLLNAKSLNFQFALKYFVILLNTKSLNYYPTSKSFPKAFRFSTSKYRINSIFNLKSLLLSSRGHEWNFFEISHVTLPPQKSTS